MRLNKKNPKALPRVIRSQVWSSEVWNLKKNQFRFLLFIWLFSSVISSFFLFQKHTVYLDHHLLYGYFFNMMRSLNQYGEPAWWFPNHQYGLPGYLMAMIGIVNAANPVFVFTGTVFWLLGILNLKVASILPTYITILFFVIPLIYLLSIWLLARQFFKKGLPIFFIITTAAFSPAIFQNLKDPGFLEITALGFFFLTAFIQFVKKGRDQDFLLLALLCFILAVSAGFALAIWNFWFLGISFVLPFLIHSRWRAQLKKRFLEQGLVRWGLVGAGTLVCFLPKFLVFRAFRGEILRYGMEEATYSIEKMHAGNPWQFLLSSIPGLGFRNLPGGDFTHFVPAAEAFFPHANYLGLLALPLIIFSFLYGRPALRNIFAAVIAVVFVVILLGPASPLMALFLMIFPPLRSMNHYFDLIHGFGGSLLLIFAMGLGIETLLSRPQFARKFLWIFGLSTLFSIVFFGLNFGERKFVLGHFTGLFILLSLLMGMVLYKLSTPTFVRKATLIWTALLVLVTLDVSSAHWAFVKTHLAPLNRDHLDDLAPNQLGTSDPTINMGLDTAFFFRPSHQLQSFGGDRLPEIGFYSQYHGADFTTDVDVALALNSKGPSIQLGREFSDRSLALPIATALSATPNALLKRLSYNSFDVEIALPVSKSLMVVRDSYFPGWRATSNGIELPIYKALGGLKAVVVTPEMKNIHFQFFPSGTAYSLLFAYLLIAVVTGLYWKSRGTDVSRTFIL